MRRAEDPTRDPASEARDDWASAPLPLHARADECLRAGIRGIEASARLDAAAEQRLAALRGELERRRGKRRGEEAA